MWHGEPGIRSNTHDVREIARTSGQSICIHFREVRLDFVVLLNVISKQIFHDFLGPTLMFSGRFGVQRKTGPVEARQGRNVLQLLVRLKRTPPPARSA